MFFHIYDCSYIRKYIYKEAHLDAITLLKCLGDSTRLRILLLTLEESELCVCEFVEALDLSQPKISRHLALMKTAKLLSDRRQGQWIHYRINEALPKWALSIIDSAAEGYQEEYSEVFSRAEVWEIWDKYTRKRFFISRGYNEVLAEDDDPYELENFFPCPDSLVAMPTA